MNWKITYSPRGPGHYAEFVHTFDHDPSPREIASVFGFVDGSHFERIIDGSFTKEKEDAE